MRGLTTLKAAWDQIKITTAISSQTDIQSQRDEDLTLDHHHNGLHQCLQTNSAFSSTTAASDTSASLRYLISPPSIINCVRSHMRYITILGATHKFELFHAPWERQKWNISGDSECCDRTRIMPFFLENTPWCVLDYRREYCRKLAVSVTDAIFVLTRPLTKLDKFCTA